VLILLLRLLGVKDEASLELATDLPRAMERVVVRKFNPRLIISTFCLFPIVRSNLSPAMKQQVLEKSENGLGYLVSVFVTFYDARY